MPRALRRTLPAGMAFMLIPAGLLTGCSAVVVTKPAPDAANPLCAEVMLQTPDSIAGMQRRNTTSQATTAYGEPAGVIITCGVEAPAPTTEKCLRVNSVDWVVKEERHEGATPSHTWTATTYGRSPSVRVVMDADRVPSSDVLPFLDSAAGKLEKQRECL